MESLSTSRPRNEEAEKTGKIEIGCALATVDNKQRIIIHLLSCKNLLLMRKVLVCLFIITWIFPAFSQEEIEVQHGEIHLKGTLLSPKKAKILVIIIAGSGPTDRNGNSPALSGQNNSLQYLAEGLENQKIASYRYDKRILNAVNPIDESTLRFDDFVVDAEAILLHFRNSGRYDKIGFMGHSEGSLIGAIAAKNTGADFLISISGAGSPSSLILKQQLSSLPKEMKDQAFAGLDSLSQGMLVLGPPRGLESIFRPSVQPYLISWFKYNPTEVFASLNCPILIIQGDNDIQVPTTEATLLFNSNPRARLAVLKGMNHVLKVCSTDRLENAASYTDPKLPVPRELLKEIGGFINGI